MAKKISQFTILDNLTGAEYFPVVHNGRNYKITFEDIKLSIDKGDLGLDKVDNTSDMDKPVSTAVAEALDRKANILHSHNTEDIEDLDEFVDNKLQDKADVDHSHDISDVRDLEEALASKAESEHNHEMSDINGLGIALANKAEAIHSHSIADVAGLSTELQRIETDLGSEIDSKADVSHTHEISDVNGLDNVLEDISNVLSTVVTQTNLHQAVSSAINNANLVNQSQLSAAVNTLTIAIGEKADRIHEHISEHITDLEPVVQEIVSDMGLGIGDVTVGTINW